MTDWSRIIQTVTVSTSACTHRQPIQTSTSSRTKDVFPASQPMLATFCILSQLALAYFALSLPLQTLRPFEVDQQIVVPITLLSRSSSGHALHNTKTHLKWNDAGLECLVNLSLSALVWAYYPPPDWRQKGACWGLHLPNHSSSKAKERLCCPAGKVNFRKQE